MLASSCEAGFRGPAASRELKSEQPCQEQLVSAAIAPNPQNQQPSCLKSVVAHQPGVGVWAGGQTSSEFTQTRGLLLTLAQRPSQSKCLQADVIEDTGPYLRPEPH